MNWPGDRAPRGAEEIAAVLAQRPPGWEYLYFAGNLLADRDTLEATFRDHEMRYAAPSGERVEDAQVAPYLRRALDQAQGLVASLSQLFEPDVLERAFGSPGQAGDPDRLRQLAERWTSVYADLLSWASRLRAANKSSTYVTLFEAVARLIDQPIQEYRDFVDELLREVDRLPQAIRSGQPTEINLTLTLSMDAAAQAAFQKELATLERLLEITRKGRLR